MIVVLPTWAVTLRCIHTSATLVLEGNIFVSPCALNRTELFKEGTVKLAVVLSRALPSQSYHVQDADPETSSQRSDVTKISRDSLVGVQNGLITMGW